MAPMAADQIRTVCCVCHAHMGGSPAAPHVSHGYCERCVAAIVRMDAEAPDA